MKKVFMMAGSLRKESVNKMLLDAAAKYIGYQKLVHCDIAMLNDHECPLYNADDEASKGIPNNIIKAAELIQSSECLIFALPEYNGFMP